MPLLYGQTPGGGWNQQFGSGNWAGAWGQRPANFGNQNAYSFFNANQGMIPQYTSGGLGNALRSWFPSIAGTGGGTPFIPPKPPVRDLDPRIGGVNAPLPRPSDPPPVSPQTPYTPPQSPYSPAFPRGDVSWKFPQVQQPNRGVPIPNLQYPDNKFAPQPMPGVGQYRTGGGWF